MYSFMYNIHVSTGECYGSYPPAHLAMMQRLAGRRVPAFDLDDNDAFRNNRS